MIITIIGAGWLGHPLALSLAKQHTVYASSRSTLSSSEYHHFTFDFTSNHANDKLLEAFKKQQPNIVIGCFPPALRKSLNDNYAKYWQMLTNACEKTAVQQVIMISTTAVYSSDIPVAREQDTLPTPLEKLENKQDVILAAEYAVHNANLNSAIIRCSGLIGPNRHPARFIDKLQQISRNAPANIIHLDDVIGVITHLIGQQGHTILNATTPETVSKAEFYQHAAKLAGITPIAQEKIVDLRDKKISAEKLLGTGYKFTYHHIFDALSAIEC